MERERTTIFHNTTLKLRACLALLTGKSTTTDASVIVYQLNTVQTSTRVTGIREALVDVSLASLACKAWETKAAVAPDLVDALSSVKAAGYS